jgi:hypothetical protein
MDSNPNILKIITWNCQSAKPKIGELSDFLFRHNISIAFLSETWLTDHVKFYVQGYSVYRCDREKLDNRSPNLSII